MTIESKFHNNQLAEHAGHNVRVLSKTYDSVINCWYYWVRYALDGFKIPVKESELK